MERTYVWQYQFQKITNYWFCLLFYLSFYPPSFISYCLSARQDKSAPQALAEPLRHFARQQLAGEEYVLLACDWSRINYIHHQNKKDKRTFSNKDDVGYDLTAQLAVNATTGSPIALLQALLKTNECIHTTLEQPLGIDTPHLDQILPMMQKSGLAILKRLLVVSMGLSLVWSLRASESPEAKEFKKLLVRLSGKSQQRGKPATAGTLLSGLFVLLMFFDFLEMMDYDVGKINKVRNLLANFLPKYNKNL